MHTSRTSAAGALVALLAIGACDQEVVDLGSDGGSKPGGGDAGKTGSTGNQVSNCPSAIDQQLDASQCGSASVVCDGEIGLQTPSTALAQSFIAAVTGTLTELKLEIRSQDPANSKIIVSIVDFGSDPDALARQIFDIDAHILTYAVVPITSTIDWQGVGFASPIKVTAGHAYAIYVEGSAPVIEWHGIDTSNVGDSPYGRGRAFNRIDASSQSEWVEIANAGFLFEEPVVPDVCD